MSVGMRDMRENWTRHIFSQFEPKNSIYNESVLLLLCTSITYLWLQKQALEKHQGLPFELVNQFAHRQACEECQYSVQQTWPRQNYQNRGLYHLPGCRSLYPDSLEIAERKVSYAASR